MNNRFPHTLILRKKGVDAPWPFGESKPVGISSWNASMPRMSLWTLSGDVVFPERLDGYLTEDVYVEANGMQWVLDGSRTTEVSVSTKGMYKHSLRFVPLILARLSRTKFYDCVPTGMQDGDKPQSNGTSFMFYGTLSEFVARMNASMAYRSLDITCSLDAGIDTDSVEISFEDVSYLEALQNAFGAYNIPWYFRDNAIHFGWGDDIVPGIFQYGVEGGLTSQKGETDMGGRITLATGRGSDRNIPPYYPNLTPKGTIGIECANIGSASVTLVNPKLFSSRVGIDKSLTNGLPQTASISRMQYDYFANGLHKWLDIPDDRTITVPSKETGVGFSPITMPLSAILVQMQVSIINPGKYRISLPVSSQRMLLTGEYKCQLWSENKAHDLKVYSTDTSPFVDEREFTKDGVYTLQYIIKVKPSINVDSCQATIGVPTISVIEGQTKLTDGNTYRDASYWGLKIEGTLPLGATITQRVLSKIKTSQYLMPSRYRETSGEDRFYPALNNTYRRESGEYYSFPNQYIEGNPIEDTFEHEEIYPSITGITNASGLRMDTIVADAIFDDGDSNARVIDDSGNPTDTLVHPRFFVRLPKYDGEYGFNLFDHAIEDQPMSLYFTSGPCAGCTFPIAVGKNSGRNPVVVDSNGMPKKDSAGNVILNIDDVITGQDDTSQNSVWIALSKEDSTFGVPMPDKSVGIYPKAGDTFVILGIEMPQSYVLTAEKRLEWAILEDMLASNIDKLTLSGANSRIVLAQNPTRMNAMTPDSRIRMSWGVDTHILYVTNMSVKRSPSEALPDISLTFAPSLEEKTSSFAESVKSIVSDVIGYGGKAGAVIDVTAQIDGKFLRRNQDDTALGRIGFSKGIEVGNANINITSDGASVMDVDFLNVRKAARFSTLEVEETRALSGSVVLSSAGVRISDVEEISGGWKCYFTPNDSNGVSAGARFVSGDLALCSSGNDGASHWYWRKVTEVGTDYLILSDTAGEFAENSDAPSIGDSLVQMGNVSDTTRQSALMVSATGITAPEVKLYRGINGFSLTDKDVTGLYVTPDAEGILYSFGQFYFGSRDINDENANFVTYQRNSETGEMVLALRGELHIGANSTGLSNLSEWSQVQGDIDQAKSDASTAASQVGAVASKLALIEDTGKVTKADYNALYNEINYIKGDYNSTSKQAELFGLKTGNSWTAYNTAYNNYLSEIQTTIQSLDSVESVSNYYLKDKQIAYYNSRTTLLNDIAQKNYENTGDSGALDDFINNTYAEDMAGILSQIDQKADTWAQEADPSVAWTTPEQKAAHKGDIWLNTDESSTDYKKSFIWDGTAWVAQEADVPIEVYDLIDGKAQIFVSQPNPPYNVGDLWVQGASGDIMRCATARENGSYVASDWVKASKYTDDTKAQSALDKAEAAKSAADTASTNAADALTAAEQAQADATDNKNKLNNWASDNIISPAEKTALSLQKKDIETEYGQITTEANSYGLASTAFTSAYNSAIAALNKYTVNPTEDTEKESDFANISAYYDARQAILDAIAAKAKDNADSAALLAGQLSDEVSAMNDRMDNSLGRLDKIDDDNVFQTTEKRAVRETMRLISSVKGIIRKTSGTISKTYTGTTSSAWGKVALSDAQYYALTTNTSGATADNTVTMSSVPSAYTGYKYVKVGSSYYIWTEDTNLMRYVGWYRSPSISDNGWTTVTVTFNVEVDCVAEMQFASCAESGYDYLIASFLDDERVLNSTNLNNFLSSCLVNTKSSNNTIITKQLGLTAGTHTIQVMYRKDSSGTNQPDSGFFRIVTEASEGVHDGLSGSFHDTLRRGIPSDIAQELESSAVALSTYLTSTCRLWINEDTDMASYPGYRDEIIRLANNYYSVLEGARENITLSGIEYLKSALKDGNVISSGGLLLAQMVAVTEMPNPGEGPEKVVAGINGSDIAKDNTHGKLMMFAGSESGLEADIAQSETRVYEDGTLITKKLQAENASLSGHVEASSGKIGAFDIGNGALSGTKDNDTLSLSPGTALFTNKTTTRDVKSSLGGGVLPDQFGIPTAMGASVKSTGYGTEVIAGYFSAIASGAQASALYVPNGNIAGMRPRTRVVTSTCTLDTFDHTIIVVASGSVVLNLPSVAEDGQTYFIMNVNGRSVAVKSSTSNIWRVTSTGGSTNSFESGNREAMLIIKCGSDWYAKYIL